MRCIYCQTTNPVGEDGCCESCHEAKLPERHAAAFKSRKLFSKFPPHGWKRFVADKESWTIFCHVCNEEFRVTFDYLESRPTNRRAYCSECIKRGLDVKHRNDYMSIVPLVIDYDKDPILARYLARRDGPFKEAKRYVYEKERALV